MTLKELKIGQPAVIDQVGGEGALRQHFLDMGVLPGAELKIEKYAPMGDPMEVRIHGYELTLRMKQVRLKYMRLRNYRMNRRKNGQSPNLSKSIRVWVKMVSIM